MDYFRALVFRLHVMLGLVAGVFFAVMGLTGAALAFRPAIEASLYWPKVDSVAAPASRAGLESAVASALQANAETKVREVNLRPGYCWEIVLHNRDGSGAKSVYADPASGAATGSRVHAESAFHWLYQVHTEFLLGRFGLQMASRVALLLLAQCVLGFLVWGMRGYPFHTHALLGVTAGLAAAFLAYTGWRMLTVPVPTVIPVVTLRGIENKAPLQDLLQTAEKRRAAPGGVAAIYFPQSPSQPFQFWFGERPSDGIVYMDPYGSVLPLLSANLDNGAQNWHRGPSGGTLARMLRLLAGVGLAGSFATGVTRYLRARALPGPVSKSS